MASSRAGRKVKVVCAEGITREEHVRRKGKGVLKVPLGEEHQQEVHTPNMFFPGDTFSTDHLYLSRRGDFGVLVSFSTELTSMPRILAVTELTDS